MKTLTASFLITLALAFVFAFAAETKHPKLLEQYEATRAGLAADDLAAAKDGASNLALAVKEEVADAKTLHDAAERVAASATLADARKAFKEVSAETVKLTRGQQGLYVMTCPMAEGALWVQTTPKVGNPYFGKSMLGCGEIQK